MYSCSSRKAPERADHLSAEIAKLQFTPPFKVHVERKTLDDLDTTSAQIAPTFVLIDPFGFSGIPYALIQRLLKEQMRGPRTC